MWFFLCMLLNAGMILLGVGLMLLLFAVMDWIVDNGGALLLAILLLLLIAAFITGNVGCIIDFGGMRHG